MVGGVKKQRNYITLHPQTYAWLAPQASQINFDPPLF